MDLFVVQPHLHGLAAQFGRKILHDLVVSRDRDQFGVEFAAEDASLVVVARAGEGASAQRAVNVDRTVGDDLRACATDLPVSWMKACSSRQTSL